jgi:hypothetical protein
VTLPAGGVDFATSFAATLTQGVRQVFPRCAVVRSAPDPGAYDLVLEAELHTDTWQVPGPHSFLAFQIRARLAIEEGALAKLDLVETVETSRTNKFHWSSQKVTEDAGGPSLHWAVRSLLEGLMASSALPDVWLGSRRTGPRCRQTGAATPPCQAIARAAAGSAGRANDEPPASVVARPAEPPNYQPEGAARSEAVARPEASAADAGEYCRLRLRVEPNDAAVYLDGRFVGTGGDVGGNEGGLVLAPGSHQITVVRPGHRTEERRIDVGAGRKIELIVKLSPSGPSG